MERSLPIWAIHSDIVGTLRMGNRLVLVAPTGSGKTTQMPQMLLDSGLVGESSEGSPKKIVVLQPRRVAARTVAARVAWERDVKLGAEVGYQIRFDDQTSLGTRICYVTEGILLRWLQDDRELSDVSVVLFDEFHERNLLSDVALALVKHLQAERRPDLKMVVMSATLDAEPVAEYLDDCPILISEDQSYPVRVQYLDQRDQRPATDQAADAVEAIVNSGAEGDILVFMPGMGEINATINALRSARLDERVTCIPLHGELPPEDQDRAFAPNPLRKVVVATNVAETSVTIDGIRHVVDCGLARVARYDAERGIGTLFIEEISWASADQRKGRAGRTAPGTCYRLWTESGHLNRAERNTPEIQRSDLAEVVLLLHSLGIKRAADFDWLDRPDPQAVNRAEALLHTLGALRNRSGQASEQPGTTPGSDLTPVGRKMLRLPMHPRYSRMLVEAAKYDCVPAAALCAALVSGRDLLVRLGREDKHIAEARELFEASQDSDFFTLMRAYQFAKKNHFGAEACRRYGIHAQTARQVDQTFEQILEIARRQGLGKRQGDPGSGTVDERSEPPGVVGEPTGRPLLSTNAERPSAAEGVTPEAQQPRDETPANRDQPLLRCIMAGFIDQLCIRRDQGSLECDLTEGRHGTLMRESVVQNSSLFVAATIREVPSRGSQPLTLLGMASTVEREWIQETFADQMTVQIEHLFDRTHKRVAAVRLERFRDLVIHHQHQREVEPLAAGRAIAEAYQKGWFELPLLNHEIKQFIGRVNLVAAVLPELDWPPLDAGAITNCLARAFAGMTLVKEAQATPLKESFLAHLVKEQVDWLAELTPLTVDWPDGRKLKIQYPEAAQDDKGEVQAPEIQVKLHECFALQQQPKVCEGKAAIKLWLCSPDGRRLEPTLDWPRFKVAGYPKLKPALQKKFPGFVWP